MKEFSADYYFAAGVVLGAYRAQIEAQIAAGKADPRPVAMHDSFATFGTTLGNLGLKLSVKVVEKLCKGLADEKVYNAQTFVETLKQLEQTIEWEMEEVTFFRMPSTQSEFYDQKELFGSDVNTKFPTVQYDMVEAGNCYAMGRGTACVFHLMRIMEVGVQNFGTKLGVALAGDKNWQNILDEINKAIKSLPAKDPVTVTVSQASANLYAVKLAWRNEVMHPKDTYTLEEAENLIRQVKLFMGQLATII